MRKRKFTTKKLINLSRMDITALKQLSRKQKVNQSEVLRQGISLMKVKLIKSPKGVSVMK